MHLILAASLSSVLIDVMLALTAFFVGFLTSLLYYRSGAASTHADGAAGTAAPHNEDAANDAARTNMAAQQLRDLARNVATDVNAHSTLVGNISDQLGSLDENAAGNNALVMDAVGKMLSANMKLQARLEDAEHKIQIQAEEIRSQQSEARTDALTKLANRRAFDACLQENIERFSKEGQPFSLIIFDVDHFKQFNDAHGHLAGDEVLRAVGRTLSRAVKSGDLPCRYGGEEFTIVMANTRSAEAKIASERIRRAIESMSVQFAGKTLHVTASVGMAEIQRGEQESHLLRRADDAVYASKNAGRNCSHWNDGVECQLIADPAKHPAFPASKSPEGGRQPALTPSIIAGGTVPGRGAFTDELGRRIAETHRSGAPLSVIQFRVKEFERVENAFGTAVGALLLDLLSTFIRSTLRDMDLLGKLEGGDFVIMLPGSSESGAKIVGHRVKTSISHCPIPLGNQQIRLDLDFGVVKVQPSDDANGVMARAKQALLETVSTQEMRSARLPQVEPVGV